MAVVIPKAKSRGKDYHYCVLYNYFEGPRSRRDDDQKLSRAFLAKMEDELAENGFTDSYHFEKIRPGKNLFEEFTAGLIEPSEKVVAILTKGFREDYWHKYTQQISFMKLLNCKTAEFLAIVIGEAKEDIPENFGLVKEQIIYFEKEWQDDEQNWNLLIRCFLENKSVQEVCQKSAPTIPVQETQDSNILAEDGAPDINNLSASSGIEVLATPFGLHGVAPPGSGGVTSGVPDGLPTTQVISNPTGPRGDTGDAATGFPDNLLPSPDDIEEDSPPSTSPTIVLPAVEQSIRKRVGEEKGLESPGDMNATSNQSSEQKSSLEETHDTKSLAEDGAPATRQDVPNINNSGVSSGIKGAARPLILHCGAPATGQEVSNNNKPSGASRGTAESASIYRPVGVTRGLPRNTPTTDVNSNPTGPSGDPVGAASTGFPDPDLQLPSPGDVVEDRAPSTPQTNPRTSPDDTEPGEPPTDVLPGDTPSIHICKRVHQERGYATGSDIDNPAEQKKSPYYMDALKYVCGNL